MAKPIQHVIDQMFVLPACDPPLGSRCATVVTHADLAGSRRVSAVVEAIADSIVARRAEFGVER